MSHDAGPSRATDSSSGNWLERLLFNNRSIILAMCVFLTVALGYEATRVRLNASFDKTIPTQHPYIENYHANQQDLLGLGNAVEVVVESPAETIFDRNYLDTLRRISDDTFLLPGVDRGFMKSLWTPTTRWIAITEQGFDGGPVIGQDYDGSPASIERIRNNVARSGELGQIVARDLRSSMIYVPLVPTTGGVALDYRAFADGMDAIRAKYESAHVKIHVVGFAQVVGDLIHGLRVILSYFAISVLLAGSFLYWYTRDTRSTLLVVLCTVVAIVWQMGIVTALGFDFDPYSILVPFLIFAIGMSHGAQKLNGIMQDVGRGLDRLSAARQTFRRLFVAGLTALVCDAVGFAVLFTIQIKVIQDLALIASIGVAVLIFTNLILLPILLSYIGVSKTAAKRSLRGERAERQHPLWRMLDLFTTKRWATAAIVGAVVIGALGIAFASRLTVGDVDAGAAELRSDSRYNRDVEFVNQHYGASTDLFAVMVKTPDGECAKYDTLVKVDALGWELRQLPGVDSVTSLATANRNLLVLYTESSPRWYEVVENQQLNNTLTSNSQRGTYDEACNLLTVYVNLKDHRAATLTSIGDAVRDFASANDTSDVHFLLAAGNAGIAAATNIVVEKANNQILFGVYAAVIILCLLTFRSWRAVVCAVLPLVLTSILAEALMVALNIGVKVATLPVIALGVGIGVDYALYIMSIMLARLRDGMTLSQAYLSALLFTGRVVMLTGVTLAVGVATWAFSPIKFQADMGVLLAFMFVVNMIGSLVLLPAFAVYMFPKQAQRDELPVQLGASPQSI